MCTATTLDVMTNPTSALQVKPIHLVPSAARLTTPLAQHLRKALRGDVLFDAASRGRYSTDASIYQIMPVGVVVPRDQDDLRAALEIVRSEKVPLLARGAGTSQCGQTVGEALVIDTSKWLNNIVDFNADARTVNVEPGVVLDHLNAWLKPHGLWFPVDVSTAAQCTIGGMAGNNSCGSRSIEYGNMVHNVEAIDAILADGSEAHFASLRNAPQGARLQQIVEGVRRIAQREHDEIVARVPKVLRRVAGYNIDLFDCQNPRAYTDDGVANLAHLLVGSEGTLAFSRQLTLKLAPLPAHKTLGVVNFPTFWQAMDLTQHIVKLKPVAVELVDRTMIDLAMSNPAFRPVVAKALFDPDNRFNPDKMVRPPKMDDARYFRFAPGYREQRMETALDWSAWNVQRDPLTGRESAPGSGNDLSGGLAKAVEMCNNNGHCRKFDAGTMCPSYRVTKDEQHVTRGRANTLRLAISGQLGEAGLASDDVKDTLDLCVSCKGCSATARRASIWRSSRSRRAPHASNATA
ncbi:MAG: Fe-S protein, homolog of lactate dehydrogenase SO1521 [uncultured Paraburkholderia sp.]|nr:MAG: Fe-S protein, homolog of lactate dehydrogenase SO1521 [uncultured Paraburkholderia sp.]